MADALQLQIAIGIFGLLGIIISTIGGIAIAKINARSDRQRADLEELQERVDHMERKYDALIWSVRQEPYDTARRIEKRARERRGDED